jgi:hypothetical protein
MNQIPQLNPLPLFEGLEYKDMVGMIKPTIHIDEFASKMGDDEDVVVASFFVRSKQAAQDLSSWFEKGYDWVLDAQTSEGEVKPGYYLVFVEINRRTTAPARILELISDLETLTNLPLKDWTIIVDKEDYEPNEDVLKQVIVTSPQDYREKEQSEESELNEMRQAAGLSTVNVYSEPDVLLKSFKSMAGL